jgi:hypothetical protein
MNSLRIRMMANDPKIIKVPATDSCTGCIFFHPEKLQYTLGMGYNRRWCSNGSYHAPVNCRLNKTIYVEGLPPAKY